MKTETHFRYITIKKGIQLDINTDGERQRRNCFTLSLKTRIPKISICGFIYVSVYMHCISLFILPQRLIEIRKMEEMRI